MQDNTSTTQVPRLGLSHGDFNGIGYEVILKAFSDARMFETFTPVLYGQSKAFSYYKKNFGLETPNYSLTRDVRQAWEKKFNIINIVEGELKIEPGCFTDLSAEMSIVSMKKLVNDLQNGYLDAMVMAPDAPKVAQSNLEYLLSFHKDAEPLRVLVNETMRIGLATDDMPLAEAITKIDTPFLVAKLHILSQALKTDFDLNAPKIAVMGVNPHAGTMPTGDDVKVVNAVADAQRNGVMAFGPFSSTQLFVDGQWRKYDAVLAMYYEQGMLPLKYVSLNGCACYWAGLPQVCTMPLHGPAFDIANLNKAEPDSYRKAVYLAIDVVNHRREQ